MMHRWDQARDTAALVLVIVLVSLGITLHPDAITSTAVVSSAAAAPRVPALSFHASPQPIADVSFQDGNGRTRRLSDFHGKVILLNVWATWCGPCRAEMPTLDRLQARLGGADFEVVALSIDRGGQAAVKSFFDETNVRALAVYVDASTDALSKLAIVGVPTTLLIDRQGREIARLTGPAEWDRQEVIDTISRYLPARRS